MIIMPCILAAPRGLKMWACCRSTAGIAGSNPAGVIDVCLLQVPCVVRFMSLRQADHSSRGVLPIMNPRHEVALAHRMALGAVGENPGPKL